jgi:hypothetical protein
MLLDWIRRIKGKKQGLTFVDDSELFREPYAKVCSTEYKLTYFMVVYNLYSKPLVRKLLCILLKMSVERQAILLG